MNSSKKNAQAERERKLALVREQVANGSLVIRKMSAKERRLYPRRSPASKAARATS
jgi:hypothetical protein